MEFDVGFVSGTKSRSQTSSGLITKRACGTQMQLKTFPRQPSEQIHGEHP